MKIVICDDSLEDLSKIEKLLLKYKELKGDVDFALEKYSDASRLFRKIKKNELADVYILDMIMSVKSGIDIGKQIRSMDDECMIVYITSSEDFALDAYGVNAIRYLVKPVRNEKFFEAMDYVFAYTNVKRDAVFLVKTKEGLVSLPCSKIEYIENSSRMLEICLSGGKLVQSIFIRKSFDEEIKELLWQDNFLQVHKSFVINLKYVKKMVQNNMVMESDKIIPVSKKRIAEVKRKYLLFVSGQYG